MKHFYSIAILFLMIFTGTKGQDPLAVTKDSLAFGKSTMPGYSVTIPEVAYDKAMKEWVKILESGTKSKVVEENGKMSIFGAKIKKISDNPLNVYSTLEEKNGTLNLRAAFELERDKFVEGKEESEARGFLFDFAKEQYVALASDQLEERKKVLKAFESDLASLERQQARMEKENRENSQLVSSENERLTVLDQELDSVPATSEATGMGVSEKDAEKEMKKTSRDIKSTEKKIQRAEEDIKRNERELPQNANEQSVLRKKIAEQEAEVEKFEKKLETIKRYRL